MPNAIQQGFGEVDLSCSLRMECYRGIVILATKNDSNVLALFHHPNDLSFKKTSLSS